MKMVKRGCNLTSDTGFRLPESSAWIISTTFKAMWCTTKAHWALVHHKVAAWDAMFKIWTREIFPTVLHKKGLFVRWGPSSECLSWCVWSGQSLIKLSLTWNRSLLGSVIKRLTFNDDKYTVTVWCDGQVARPDVDSVWQV